MTVTPTASDTNATIRVNGTIVASGTASANIPLTVGSNTINVVVTAQDGSTTKTYTITVTRAGASNADLSNLTVSQGTLSPGLCSSYNKLYGQRRQQRYRHDRDADSLLIPMQPSRVNGTIVASGAASANIPLTVGSNTINVVVTAQDGSTTKTYTITVTRASLHQCRPEQPHGQPGHSHPGLCHSYYELYGQRHQQRHRHDRDAHSFGYQCNHPRQRDNRCQRCGSQPISPWPWEATPSTSW